MSASVGPVTDAVAGETTRRAPAALPLSRLIESLLFGVTARDPITYAGVAALMALTGVLACVMPARQALRVDVVSALRAE